MVGEFEQIYQQSLAQPEAFWAAAADDIDWFKKWDNLLV